MSYSHLHSAFSMNHLIDNFNFGATAHSTVVDVGGSHGQVSIAIARKYPDIKCIVQDLPDTISGLDSQVPMDLKDRVSGMEHDFLTPQPVKDADIYLLRWILHDWSDKYCVKVLQSLTPAFEKGRENHHKRHLYSATWATWSSCRSIPPVSAIHQFKYTAHDPVHSCDVVKYNHLL